MDSGYTVVENDTLWVDLSCRALGLLVRWLSKPAGVEVDTIPDIITRSRRRGNKRMEGRDALYTASYELEEEGFLVRRLFTNEKGQHEWAAFIRSRPVPQSERSNPADRKRATAKNGRTKKPAGPKPATPSERPSPGNPFSGPTRSDPASSQASPSPGKPDSGEPDSENQASSYQSSLHSSLSGNASAAGADGQDGEREAAAQEDDTATAQAVGESVDDVNQVVDAFVVAWMSNRGKPPYPRQIASVREDAAFLLAKGRTARNLCGLAADMAHKGWTDLAQHAQMNPEASARPTVQRRPWCGECNSGREPMSAAERMVETDTGMAKCQCHPGYVPPQPVRS
ncbi:hypothetical protein P1P75_35750 [Streptomyces sp. ID05-39B]|uniref:hypothetical protein n=1 Tax=Streptomyces sp. ID05-39B TaxID=3028664 RepID=UPI0029AC976D|nr:hypothetical protein [Streptomyces sp. ID05-39B]MDX3531608.1 hypothetical protein [Streptomyces sp. ID05-39B]